MTPVSVRRRRWANYAACLWALAFAAPHTWWALGSPFAFPGGPANHQLMMTSSWRLAYDLAVILLSVVAAVLALVLLRLSADSKPFGVLRTLAWIASVVLGLRGVAGLAVDGVSDLTWSPTFVVGGLLFGLVASAADPRSSDGSRGRGALLRCRRGSR